MSLARRSVLFPDEIREFPGIMEQLKAIGFPQMRLEDV
jgi:hypothetical protein